jgi:hypothetical protein
MSESQTPEARPASSSPAIAGGQAFYKAENYRAEESIGYLMRRIMSAVAQSVELACASPAARPIPQWLPLHKLHMGRPPRWPNWPVNVSSIPAP